MKWAWEPKPSKPMSVQSLFFVIFYFLECFLQCMSSKQFLTPFLTKFNNFIREMFDIRVIDYGDGLVVCSDELWLDGAIPRQWNVSIESSCYSCWEDRYGEENEIFIKPQIRWCEMVVLTRGNQAGKGVQCHFLLHSRMYILLIQERTFSTFKAISQIYPSKVKKNFLICFYKNLLLLLNYTDLWYVLY